MGAVRFFFSPLGRASRDGMAFATFIFVAVGLFRGQMSAQGATMVASVATVVQLLLIWPSQIAVPIKRFRSMGRRGFWIAVFWGAAGIGLLFTHWGLGQTAALVDMTAMQAWIRPGDYISAISALNETREPESAIKLLNGAGMGGISLAMIFLIIQFGWLHFIPGTSQANRVGSSSVETTEIPLNDAIGD